MAIEATVDETRLPHDETAEEALERAISAWASARSRFATVDPTRLSPAGLSAYYRVLARIGLWSDARVVAGAASEDPSESDESFEAAETD